MGADLEVLARAWPTAALAGVNYTEIAHAIALAGRPHITTIVNTYLAANLPLRLNTSPEIAQCLLVADSWSNWTPAPALSTLVDERDLDRWAWPETIPSSGVRTAGVVALLWEAFGPIRTCPQASSSRIP